MNVQYMHTHTRIFTSLCSQRSPLVLTHIHTSAPVNHLRPGNSSRKPQRECCWQEAAALHLSVKVSKYTMWLSSPPSSLFTSLHTSLCLYFDFSFTYSVLCFYSITSLWLWFSVANFICSFLVPSSPLLLFQSFLFFTA